uniref:Uncharacterized protein n=1 Tax=Physcomitrium patens TaxID=3218 RepID=A0A2K1KN58_PHYPA|nr:hypothetical protein PHYPA_006104 [Physcomitrium patens]
MRQFLIHSSSDLAKGCTVLVDVTSTRALRLVDRGYCSLFKPSIVFGSSRLVDL